MPTVRSAVQEPPGHVGIETSCIVHPDGCSADEVVDRIELPGNDALPTMAGVVKLLEIRVDPVDQTVGHPEKLVPSHPAVERSVEITLSKKDLLEVPV
jgi:hypothetical protein